MSVGEDALMQFSAWGYEFREPECREEPGFRDWVKREGLWIERKSIYKRRTDLKRRQTSKAAEGLNSGAGRTLCAQALGMKTAQLVNTVLSHPQWFLLLRTGCWVFCGPWELGRLGSLGLRGKNSPAGGCEHFESLSVHVGDMWRPRKASPSRKGSQVWGWRGQKGSMMHPSLTLGNSLYPNEGYKV